MAVQVGLHGTAETVPVPVPPGLRFGGGPGLGEELADVAIYLLGLAEILHIDLGAEVERKMEINRRRRYAVVDGVWQRLDEDN